MSHRPGRPPARVSLARCAGLSAGWLAAMLCSGCVVASVVDGVGTVAVAAVKTTGKVAGATARAAGHVTASGISASGEVAGASIQAAAKLSKEGAVVFFDPKSGAVWEAPWSQGLKLLAASETAKVDLAYRAVRIIRNSKAITTAASEAARVAVHSGDVVELTPAPAS